MNNIKRTNNSGPSKNGRNPIKKAIYFPPKKGATRLTEISYKFTVIGNLVTKEFIYCYYLVKGLHKYRKNKFQSPEIRGISAVEWPKVWNDLKTEYSVSPDRSFSPVAVIINDKFLGGDKELKAFIGTKYIYHLSLDYYQEGIKQFTDFITSSGKPFVYMHFTTEDNDIGTMIFMLYADKAPNICDNFLKLCEATKGGYSGTSVHRIVKDCWIQCGDLGTKTSPKLYYQNSNILHDRRGVLCMARPGRNGEWSTQFFVLLQPARWMKKKYVAFGQLIQGKDALKKIENVPTRFGLPTQEINIYKTGLLKLESQYLPVNKNTTEYLKQHVEDPHSIGTQFCKELIKSSFEEIAKIETKEELKRKVYSSRSFMGEDIKELHVNLKYKTSTCTGSVRSTDKFGMNASHTAFGDYSDAQVSNPTFVKSVKNYLPLTDVPYPGEVDSTFDFKKLLSGDYSHESDIQIGEITKKDQRSSLNIPHDWLYTIFIGFDKGDGIDLPSAGFVPENAFDLYSENPETVSYAGSVVKRIANIDQKYDVFDPVMMQKTRNNILSDEEVRLMRVASKEYQKSRSLKIRTFPVPAKQDRTNFILCQEHKDKSDAHTTTRRKISSCSVFSKFIQTVAKKTDNEAVSLSKKKSTDSHIKATKVPSTPKVNEFQKRNYAITVADCIANIPILQFSPKTGQISTRYGDFLQDSSRDNKGNSNRSMSPIRPFMSMIDNRMENEWHYNILKPPSIMKSSVTCAKTNIQSHSNSTGDKKGDSGVSVAEINRPFISVTDYRKKNERSLNTLQESSKNKSIVTGDTKTSTQSPLSKPGQRMTAKKKN